MLLEAAKDIQASVARWESATLWATVASAIFTSVSALLALGGFYRSRWPHNRTLVRLDRQIGLEKASLALAIVAATSALAGALFSIRYTAVNRRQQYMADQENLELHRQLAQAQRQSTSASRTATEAATDLAGAKDRLAKTERDLADSYQQLADAKQRLQNVEAQIRWRTLSPGQRKRMITILSRWKGSFVAFNPIAGDPEIHSFASEIRVAFEKSGWRTAWQEFMEFSGTDAPPTQGIQLELPSVLEDRDLVNDVIKAAQIADPAATLRYLTGNESTARAIHVVVGKRPGPYPRSREKNQ